MIVIIASLMVTGLICAQRVVFHEAAMGAEGVGMFVAAIASKVKGLAG